MRNTINSDDVERFVASLKRVDQHPVKEVRELFEPLEELIVSRAPGRLDVMGGIADYSGSLVLQRPLKEAALVALQRIPRPDVRIVSMGLDHRPLRAFQMPLADFLSNGKAVSYEAARTIFPSPSFYKARLPLRQVGSWARLCSLRIRAIRPAGSDRKRPICWSILYGASARMGGCTAPGLPAAAKWRHRGRARTV